MRHTDIWKAVDSLAERNGLSASGLARRAGLDPTAFNKSKRANADGTPRLTGAPRTVSLASVTLPDLGVEKISTKADVVRAAAAGFQQTSETLEEAAQNLGCPPLKSLVKITLPLIAANLIAGGLLAFAFAMLEVSDSLILAQQAQHYPITKAIYNLNGALGNGEALASALGVWAMVFLTITLAGTGMILGKKMGALFRA